MIGISAMIVLKGEIIILTALILGLSWIAVKMWLPVYEWTPKNLTKRDEKGIRQWVSILAGGSFFIGTPIILVEILIFVSEEINSWTLNIIIGLMLTHVIYTRVIRESSVRLKGETYERGGLAGAEYNFIIYAILWSSLLIAVSFLGLSSEAFILTLILLLEGGTQFTMRNQSEKKLYPTGVKKETYKGSIERAKEATNLRDKQYEKSVKARKFLEHKVW